MTPSTYSKMIGDLLHNTIWFIGILDSKFWVLEREWQGERKESGIQLRFRAWILNLQSNSLTPPKLLVASSNDTLNRPGCLLLLLTFCVETKLSTGNYCICGIPGVFTHCSPLSLEAYFHSTFKKVPTSYQLNISVVANRSCRCIEAMLKC